MSFVIPKREGQFYKYILIYELMEVYSLTLVFGGDNGKC